MLSSFLPRPFSEYIDRGFPWCHPDIRVFVETTPDLHLVFHSPLHILPSLVQSATRAPSTYLSTYHIHKPRQSSAHHLAGMRCAVFSALTALIGLATALPGQVIERQVCSSQTRLAAIVDSCTNREAATEQYSRCSLVNPFAARNLDSHRGCSPHDLLASRPPRSHSNTSQLR